MIRWLRVPIRTALLLALLIACTAPLGAYWWWSYDAALSNAYDEVRERHRLTAKNLRSTLIRYHRDLVSVFSSFAPEFAAGREIGAFGESFNALDLVYACAFDRETGALTAAALQRRDQCPGRVDADRLNYYRLVAGPDGDVAVTSAAQSADQPARLLMITTSGERVVIGGISGDYIRDLGQSIHFGQRGHAALVDQTGRVLSHPLPDWTAQARDISSVSLVRRILAGQEGVDFFFSPAIKELVIAAYTPVPGPGWGVMVVQPVSELAAQARDLTNVALYAVAAAVGLSVLISIIFATVISRPVNQVAEAARKMAAGEGGAKLSEKEVDQPLKELRDLAQSFNSMAAKISLAQSQEKKLRLEAERATKAKSMFLANMSHEIRTPMNGILGVAALLKETDLDHRQKMLVGKIAESGEGLMRIVNDVLDSSRIEAGTLEVREGPFDLRSLVSSVRDLAAAQVRDRKLAVEVDFPEAMPSTVVGDADRVRQILLNLVQNAIRFTPAGTVIIAVEPIFDQGRMTGRKVSVIDNGPGVPEKLRGAIFEKFAQAETSAAAEVSGAGLGLSIARSLVEAMGGEIGLDPTPGGGATFWFTLYGAES